MRPYAMGVVVVISLIVATFVLPQQSAQAMKCYDDNKNIIPCPRSDYSMQLRATKINRIANTPVFPTFRLITIPTETPTTEPTLTLTPTPSSTPTIAPTATPTPTFPPAPMTTQLPESQFSILVGTNAQTCESDSLFFLISGFILLIVGLILLLIFGNQENQSSGFNNPLLDSKPPRREFQRDIMRYLPIAILIIGGVVVVAGAAEHFGLIICP